MLGIPKEQIDVAIDEGVPIVITSAGSPATYTRYLKDAGTKVPHVVAAVRHARRAEAEGVGAVIAEGRKRAGV
ncbi:MAG: nitronate monooxygenase [Dehalococcoidia bacterium]